MDKKWISIENLSQAAGEIKTYFDSKEKTSNSMVAEVKQTVDAIFRIVAGSGGVSIEDFLDLQNTLEQIRSEVEINMKSYDPRIARERLRAVRSVVLGAMASLNSAAAKGSSALYDYEKACDQVQAAFDDFYKYFQIYSSSYPYDIGNKAEDIQRYLKFMRDLINDYNEFPINK